MRHRVRKTGLQKTQSKTKAMRRNLLTSLFKHEKIKTTEKRARSIEGMTDKIVNVVREKEPKDAVRYLQTYLTEPQVAKKVMTELKDKFDDRKSGYSSIYKLGNRDGDGASIVQMQLNLK